MIERELTGLEQRLYKFLDDIDTILEYDCDYEKWNRIREKMKRCKEDCKVQFGVVSNGYSLHIELPYDVNKGLAGMRFNK